jgi:acyl-CoA dehydrogenase family protein 9
MVGLQSALTWNGKEGFGANVGRIVRHGLNFEIQKRGIALALEIFLGVKKSAPRLRKVHPELAPHAARFEKLVQSHSHHFKKISFKLKEKVVVRGAYHARFSDVAMWLHGMACTLSKLDRQIGQKAGGPAWERDRAAGLHFLDMAEKEIQQAWTAMYSNPDETMLEAAKAALAYSATLPNAKYVLPEKSPVAAGQGKSVNKESVKQFPGDKKK